MTISQGLAKVVFHSGKIHWLRISRRKIDSVVDYLTKQHGFYYAKIYHYHGGGKGYDKYDSRRSVGSQIGFISKNKITGLYEFRLS